MAATKVQPRVELGVTALDCPDPLALAAFYSALTGLKVEPLGDFPPEDVTWIELVNEDGPTLGFQKIESYVAPTWPEGPVPQQLHLDFIVDDLDEAEAHALRAGAAKAAHQPGDTFRVFFDPAGHPFCLVLRSQE
jgi:catechol 2,3-dioxygenase-like lactoylglutathione lyase family enzyme